MIKGIALGLLLLLSPQNTVLPKTTILPKTAMLAPSPAVCAGLPSYNLQLKGTTPTAGAVSTWADTSGNSNTVTITGSPVAGLGTPTPSNTQTVVFTGTQYGNLTNAITTSSAVSVCAVYELSSTSAKQTLTGNSVNNGEALYYPTNGSGGAQGLDSAFVNNVDMASASATTTWVDTCVSYTIGGTVQFYRNGATDGTGVTASQTFSAPINQVFAFTNTTYPLTAAVAELDVMNIAITPTQAASIHSCAVSTYGVP